MLFSSQGFDRNSLSKGGEESQLGRPLFTRRRCPVGHDRNQSMRRTSQD
jgi:hypothetical protein